MFKISFIVCKFFSEVDTDMPENENDKMYYNTGALVKKPSKTEVAIKDFPEYVRSNLTDENSLQDSFNV